MKTKSLGTAVLWFSIGWLVLVMVSPCPGSGGNVFRTQGLINPGGNLKAGYLFINEMRVYIGGTTQVMDVKGKAIPVAELKPKRWVYMEVEKDPNQKLVKARSIYLLPHYITPKEKQGYSFMN